MKKLIFKPFIVLALIIVALPGCQNNKAEDRVASLKEVEVKPENTSAPAAAPEEKKPEGPLAAISFQETNYDFGTVNEGEIIEHTFSLSNTGDAPLIIQNAQASCGCTVPDWTKGAIPVGQKGFVKAKFDSNGKSGVQNKTVTVVANTWPQQTVLRFKVVVNPKPQQPDAGPLKQ